jgi:hypothetical protein
MQFRKYEFNILFGRKRGQGHSQKRVGPWGQVIGSSHRCPGHTAVLRSARMGVLPINPAGSSETSSEGNNDIKSIEKDVIAVVTCSFAVE